MNAVNWNYMPELLVALGVAMLLFGGKNCKLIAAGLAEGLSNLRGGPGSPSHPIPADDSRILNRRRVKPSENSASRHSA